MIKILSKFSVKYFIPLAAIFGAASAFYVTNLYWENKHQKLKSDLQAQKLEAIENVLIIERLEKEKSDAIAAKLSAEDAAREVKTETITKEVIKYVTKNENASCELDPEWVRIANDSTPMPRTPQASSSTNGTSSGVSDLGEALRIMTSNYQKCQKVVDRYQAWQEWYRSISDSSDTLELQF